MDEIPVKIGRDTKWISGINENTKCVDIVTGVLQAANLLDVCESDVNTHYALVEMWRGVTKVLKGNSPILRIWKAWADEQPNVCFIVKRFRNPQHDRESSISKPTGSGNVNLIEKMRTHVKEEEISQKTRKKLARRNSSINRQRRPPDTLHPNAVSKNKQELCESIEEKMKVMLLQSESLKEEIAKLDLKLDLKLTINPIDNTRITQETPSAIRMRPRDQSQDTSEDSGIVTDDSDAKSVINNSRYFNVKNNNSVSQKKDRYVACEPRIVNNRTPDLPLKPPPDDPSIYEWVATMDKINNLNKLLVQKQEAIVALQYELNMLKDARQIDPCPLDCFNTEVVKYREINAKLLEDITINRKHIEKANEETNASKKVINQLEFDINLVEREGKRLENGLSNLQNIELICEEDSESAPYNSLPPRLYSVYEQQELPVTLPNIHEPRHHETTTMLPANTRHHDNRAKLHHDTSTSLYHDTSTVLHHNISTMLPVDNRHQDTKSFLHNNTNAVLHDHPGVMLQHDTGVMLQKDGSVMLPADTLV